MKIHSKIQLLAMVFVTVPLVYTGCNYEVRKSGGGKPVNNLKPSSVPDFKTLNEKILQAKCTKCHLEEDRFDTSNYDLVFAKRAKIRDLVLRGDSDPKKMPPDRATTGRLTQEELDLLVGWIDSGAAFGKPGESPSPGPSVSPTPEPTPVPTPDPGVKQPSFKQLKTAFVEKKCLGCHQGEPFNEDLREYAQFKKYLKEIRRRILLPLNDPAKEHMPRVEENSEQLTNAELNTLLGWIDSGARENGTSVSAPSPALKPTFASIKKNIFLAKCMNCHAEKESAGKAFPLLRLEKLIVNDKTAVMARDPVHSKLIIAVTRRDENRMPESTAQVPRDPLTQAEVVVLKRWIELGCPP